MREKSAHSHIKMLSDEQMQAAKAAVGPVLVTGGHGTGKSVALMARLSGILNSGASASQILFLTTNARRAADLRVELPSFLRRFSPNVLPEVLGKVQPTILENLANSLLRRYGAEVLGIPEGYTVQNYKLATQTAKRLLDDECHQQSISSEEEVEILRWHWLQRSRLQPDSAPGIPHVWVNLLDHYAERKRANRILDQGYLIPLTVEMLQGDPHRFAGWRKKGVKHLLVDDFQNITAAGYRLLHLLIGKDGSIVVGGDSSQCIGTHMGADSGHLNRFRRDYPTLQAFQLKDSHGRASGLTEMAVCLSQRRAPERVVSSIDALGQQGSLREVKNIVLVEVTGNFTRMCGHIAGEAEFRHRKGLAWEDMAVICRRHKLIDELANLLCLRNIPFTEMGDDRWKGVGDEQSGIALTTIHASLGRHWKLAWIADVGDHVIPGPVRPMGVSSLEEKNLFFVAATRAARELRLIYSSGNGQRAPSRFLEPIYHLLERRRI